MKKILTLFIVVLLVEFLLSGCASIQKKFTRKKTEHKSIVKFYSDKDFKRAPNDILYKEHLNYFRSWLDEILESDSLNYKTDLRSINEAVRHLEDMEKYLPEEKQANLKNYVTQLNKIADKISKGSVKVKENVYMVSTIRSIKRNVENNYSFKMVKDILLKD